MSRTNEILSTFIRSMKNYVSTRVCKLPLIYRVYRDVRDSLHEWTAGTRYDEKMFVRATPSVRPSLKFLIIVASR